MAQHYSHAAAGEGNERALRLALVLTGASCRFRRLQRNAIPNFRQ
jgi:hypothetical protein